MTLIYVGDLLLDVDVESTRAGYLEVTQSGAQTCTCLNCANFLAAREEYFPAALRELLAELGIDWRKEAEVFDLRGGPVDGRLLYSGWFHTFGTVVEGPAEQTAAWNLARGPQVYIKEYWGAPRILDESHRPYSHHTLEVSFTLDMPWVLA
jgi:hypothetical protein